MPRPEPPDPTAAAARLQALGLGRAAWVPEQPAGVGERGDEAVPSVAGPGMVGPAVVGPARPSPARGVGDVVERVTSWLDGVRLAPNGSALAALAVACALALVVTGVVLHRHHAAAGGAPPPAVAGPPPAATPAGIVVDVGGRVRHPGLVTLPSGSRVADALRAAGGALRSADLVRVNLAARLSDGQLLLIGVPGGDGSGGTAAGGSGPVDLNTATLDQLEALPGVGPVLAQHIIDWRQAHSGFRSVADLQDVPGIGERKYADLHALVTV